LGKRPVAVKNKGKKQTTNILGLAAMMEPFRLVDSIFIFPYLSFLYNFCGLRVKLFLRLWPWLGAE